MTILALDVGGTSIRGRVTNARGDTVAHRSIPNAPRDPGLSTLWSVASQLAREATGQGLPIRAIGLGMPEYVAPQGLLQSREVLDWDRQPYDMLKELAPVVAVDSDVRCAALAEDHAASPAETLVVISVGTGVSHAAVIAGEVLTGARGEAIGLGQVPLCPTRSDSSATVETIASGAGIAHRYCQRSGREVTDGAREVLDHAARGDRDARAIINDAGDALAYAAWVAVLLYDPSRLILTGGLGSAKTLLQDRMLTGYSVYSQRRPNSPPIEVSVHGDQAGIRGAELLARRALEKGE